MEKVNKERVEPVSRTVSLIRRNVCVFFYLSQTIFVSEFT